MRKVLFIPCLLVLFPTLQHPWTIQTQSEEVFARQPEHVQTFLLHTSILDQFTGSLCDAITGRSDGQRILEMLEQAGLFIVPLDDERRWYRYHHLFADILYRHLCQASPSLLPELHQRASEWYEHHEMVSKAVEHALAAKDFTRAMCLTERQADSMWMRGDLPTLLEWLQALPDDLVRSRPRLCLFYGWAFYTLGQVDAAMPYLQAAECALNAHIDSALVDAPVHVLEAAGQNASPEHTGLQSMRAVVHASIAIMQGDNARTIEHGHYALAQLSEETSPWRGVITLGLGFAYQAAGDVVAASRAINEASRISRRAGNDYTRFFALSTLAQLQVGRDEFRAYHAFHNRTLPFLVILPSLLALVSAVLLLWIRPASVLLWSAVLVVVLDLAVLISTAAWQAPLHEKLDRKGFSTEVIDTLVKSNWIRTALWTINALLLLGMTATALLAAR